MQNHFEIVKGLMKLSKNLKDLPTSDKSVNMAMFPYIHIYQELLHRLEHDKELFLDKELSLNKLSSVLGTNTTYLSYTINIYFKCNFKTLINRCRLEHCIQLLADPEKVNIRIKELAVKCGFASKSAFHAAFKKEKGTSPQKYRKAIILKYINGEIPENIPLKEESS